MTKINCWVILLSLLSFSFLSEAQTTIKIACVGNSITYGAGLKNQHRDGYPGLLGQMLGADYEVRNYGYSGRTLLNKGDRPYMKETMYKDALAFCPDIVTIKLGTNDTKPFNWKYKDEFPKDLETMVREFQALPSHPQIYLCYPVPAYRLDWGINDSIIREGVRAYVDEVAAKTGVQVIDLYTPFSNRPEWFSDKIHPNEKGAFELAKLFYKVIKGKEVANDFQPQAYPGVKSQWEGYDCYSFNYKERQVKMIVPKTPAEGTPWIWRTTFPDAQSIVDLSLLEKGYHVIYFDVTDKAPLSQDTLKAGDYLYKYLKNSYHFSGKAVMEGSGTSALYALQWAAAYPHKVSGIYLDAPLVDWTVLDTLAHSQKPILLVRNTQDKVVSDKENGKVLEQQYRSLGGPIDVIKRKKLVPVEPIVDKIQDFSQEK